MQQCPRSGSWQPGRAARTDEKPLSRLLGRCSKFMYAVLGSTLFSLLRAHARLTVTASPFPPPSSFPVPVGLSCSKPDISVSQERSVLFRKELG